MGTTKKTLAIYWQENMRYKGLFLGTIFTWLSGMLLQKLLLPLIVARAFDKIIESAQSGGLTLASFKGDIVLFIVVALIAQAAIDSGLLLLSKMETRVMSKLHIKVYNHLLSQSSNFHANSFSGSLVTQANRFVNAYITITDAFVINISQIFVLVVLSSVVIAFYSPVLALTLIVWSAAFIYINYVLTKKRMKFSKAAAKADTVLTGYLADSMSNVAAIKAFATESTESYSFSKLAKDKAQKRYAAWMRAVKNDATFGLLMSSLQVLVLVVSVYLVQHGHVTIGTLVLVQVYITQIISNLWGLSGLTRNIEQNLSDAAEMTEILGQEIDIKDAKSAKKLSAKRGKIEFKDVTFVHADSDQPLFSGLNLRIQAGEKVGLVGASGGGKTTMTKLLLRLSDIAGGQILIDGQNIAHVTQESLRQHIAYVPQEPALFHRSLQENIAYGKPDASQKEIEAIAKLAHAHEFIRDLPEGYATLVGERGVKLSGGQRQRVAIARAMLKNAPILILDEATSALDSESENLIQDALWKLMEGRTAIVIAHRLSTIQKMDRILVMENGQIIEQGTHKELLRHSGKYAELWDHQSGGFIDE